MPCLKYRFIMATPSYLNLQNDLLIERAINLEKRVSPCMLCPRQCRVFRNKGETGFCKTGPSPEIASFGPHFGEESPMSGRRGSGTVFFSGCTMGCRFCQNYEISRGIVRTVITVEDLARIFLSLQASGCHNINLVTPTHQIPGIIRALIISVEKGLQIPLVYNTSGYEDIHTLQLLEGIIDIYMPDIKFQREETGILLGQTRDYYLATKSAVLEMFRQVGDLVLEDGIANRGLLIRHLLLPGHFDETAEILRFIAKEVSRDAWVNLMDQYHPAGEIIDSCPDSTPELQRRVTRREVEQAIRVARKYGLSRGFTE